MELNLNVGEMVIALIPSFLYAIVIAAVVSFFFILTLKWSAAFVFWGFVGLVMLCLVGLMIGVVVIGVTANFEGKDDAMVCFWLTTGTNHFLELCNFLQLAIYIQTGILSVILLLFIILLYCFRRKIRCGIEIVKESSRAVCASFGSILFPLLPFLFRAAVVLGTIYILIMAYTMRDNHYTVEGLNKPGADCSCKSSFYTDGLMCTPEDFNKDCRSSDGGICTAAICKLVDQTESALVVPFLVATIMISMWIVAFIQANSKMILAHVYGNWYWNWNREFIPTGAVLTAIGKILG